MTRRRIVVVVETMNVAGARLTNAAVVGDATNGLVVVAVVAVEH